MPKITAITPSIRPQFLDITQKTLEAQTFQDFEWLTAIGLRNRGFTFPEDMNNMLRQAKGEIIVSLQDCIEIGADALERIAALSYERTAYTFPVGKKGDSGVSWDWRKDQEQLLGTDEITPNMWEIDLASAPKSLFFDVGGFDERFKGWGWDNVEIAWRAEAAGYKFMSSTVIEGIALDHDKLVEHPHRGKLPNNDALARETADNIRKGEIKLPYLF